MIDRLERAGFVARTRDPHDRRRVVVELQIDRARSDIAPIFVPLIKSWRTGLADHDERDLQVIADFLAAVEQAFEYEVDRPRDAD